MHWRYQRGGIRLIAAALLAGGCAAAAVAITLTASSVHMAQPAGASRTAPQGQSSSCQVLCTPHVTPPHVTPPPVHPPTPSLHVPGTPRPTSLPGLGSALVTVCGTQLCIDGAPWFMNGATIFNPGLRPEQSGWQNAPGTIRLAEEAHLNTIRVINFYPNNGDPATEPYNATSWREVDQMIAAAGAAGMHIDLGLGDYRNTLWNDCINPYTYNWSNYIHWVATRRNTVTGAVYGRDPTIAFMSVTGEPLPVGSHTFVAQTTHASCTISYSTTTLTHFYAAALAEWKAAGATVLVNSGGLGYLNFNSGIDWKSIYSLPDNAFCDFKTYGGMLNYAQTVAAFCRSLGKPYIDEEFGYQQSDGDTQRAAEFANTYTVLRSIGAAGAAFWNLGYQVAPYSYDVSPSTAATFTSIAATGY